MKTIFKYMIVSTMLYFGINWIADNPKAMKNIRRMMNEGVADAAAYTSDGLKAVQEGATQSVDK